jgi:hypothetical protein
MLAVSTLPSFLMQAHGQQEVDPDHFDQPAAAKANGNTLKSQTNHRATGGDHQAHKHVRMASKRNGKKPNHLQVQIS